MEWLLWTTVGIGQTTYDLSDGLTGVAWALLAATVAWRFRPEPRTA